LDRRHSSSEAEKQRAHANAEARAARNHATRFDAYREASRYLERLRLWVEFTEPILGPAPDPPSIERDQRRVIELGLVGEDVAVRVRGHGKGSLPDVLADPGPRRPPEVQERDAPMAEVMR
jgi:hypothetical protein